MNGLLGGVTLPSTPILFMQEGKEVSKEEFFSQSPAEHIVKLTKRASPRDYWDGYIAGLKAASETIDKFIEIAEQTRALDNRV